jgi:hypothetical protein
MRGEMEHTVTRRRLFEGSFAGAAAFKDVSWRIGPQARNLTDFLKRTGKGIERQRPQVSAAGAKAAGHARRPARV